MSIKQVVKQLGAALVAAVTIALVTTPGHATFTSISSNTYTASVTVGGGATTMSIALLNVVGGASASAISWTASAGNSWVEANQYLKITSQMNQQNGAYIQTYMNNTASGASPQYTGAISTAASPAGLVDVASPASPTLPVAWTISTTTPQGVADPNCTGASSQPSYCSGQAQTGWAWFYYQDKAQSGGFTNGNSYAEVETAGVPANIQYAQTSFGAGAANGVNNMYLEALFQNANATAYGTSTLTVELAHP
jgi:hypothetical protein